MGKDSFVIYKSFYEPIKTLSDKQLGRLFRALFDYQIDGSMQVDADLQMAFAFFKNQMDIDSGKYQKVVERNKLNGLKGGRPVEEENPRNPVGYLKPKKADNDNDNETDNVNDNDLFKKEIEFQNFGKVVKTNEDFIEKALSDEEDEFRNLCKKAGLVGNFETVIKDFYQKQKVLGKNWSNFSDFKRHFHNSVPYLKSNKPSNNAEITEEKVRSLGYKSVEQFRKVNSG